MIFNILIEINYYKWIVFKNLQRLLTQLVSFTDKLHSLKKYKINLSP